MKTISHFSMAVIAVLLVMGVALADQPEAKSADPVKQAVADANTFTTDDGTTYFTCPVSHMTHSMDEAAAASVIDGKRYYHCNVNSQAPFRADPDKYLKADGYFVPANLTTYNMSGATFRDPVTDQVKVLQVDTPYHTVGIKRYFFASEESLDTFAANPAAYLKTSE